MKLVPWEEAAIQLEPQEKAMFEVAFAAARSKHDIVQLTIWGRRYIVAPSGKVFFEATASDPLTAKEGT